MVTIVSELTALEATQQPGDGDTPRWLVDDAQLEALTGWSIRPEGLCRGDVCVPAHARPDVRVGDRVDVGAVADLLRMPVATDAVAGVVVLGMSAPARAAHAKGNVGDLVLRDVEGNAVAWSALGRKKKVLVAWASW